MVRGDQARFLVIVESDFMDKLLAADRLVRVENAPGTSAQMTQLFESQVRGLLGHSYVNAVLDQFDAQDRPTGDSGSRTGNQPLAIPKA